MVLRTFAKSAMDRDVELCFTPLSKPKIKALEYPFEWIGEENYGYSVRDFCRGFADEEPGDPGNFPNNIVEYYWIKEGENDYEAWHCLCKLDTGYYAYYNASCDYTGFDCQGGMLLFISKNKERLFYEAMDLVTRLKCIKGKEKKARRAKKKEKRESKKAKKHSYESDESKGSNESKESNGSDESDKSKERNNEII